MRVCALTLEEMTEGRTRGWDEQDSRAYMKLQIERAGVEVQVDRERIRKSLEADETVATDPIKR